MSTIKFETMLKRISGISFALAFIMAIVLFTRYGSSIIPMNIAKYLFILFGAIALFTNLISFQQGKHSPIYSFSFWAASILLFIGFIFKIMHWPYSSILMIIGLSALGLTFFIPSKRSNEVEKDDELLDNF